MKGQTIQIFIDGLSHIKYPPQKCRKFCDEFIEDVNWCPWLRYYFTKEVNAFCCTKKNEKNTTP